MTRVVNGLILAWIPPGISLLLVAFSAGNNNVIIEWSGNQKFSCITFILLIVCHPVVCPMKLAPL
jgi:hypothetical protein